MTKFSFKKNQQKKVSNGKFKLISSKLKPLTSLVNSEWFIPSEKVDLIRFLPNDKNNPLTGDFTIIVKKHYIIHKGFVDCNGTECSLCKNNPPQSIYRCNILNDDKVKMWDMSEYTYKTVHKIYSDLDMNPTDLEQNILIEVSKKPNGTIEFNPFNGEFSPVANTDQGIDDIISRLYNLKTKKCEPLK